jgi:hypothetical protein
MSKRMARGEDEEMTRCASAEAELEEPQVIDAVVKDLGGGLEIRRALPRVKRRMIGPWCFLDHFGPLALDGGNGMDVAPHPHIGLQTVTWLIDGEVMHKDSLGSRQLIRPGQLNVMTSGRGISHSEETPDEHAPSLHGVQFWVALPEAERARPPEFEHHPALPRLQRDGLDISVVTGEALGELSPAQMYSPMMGLDVRAHTDGDRTIPLNPAWEHGIVVLVGEVEAQGVKLVPGQLCYLGVGREHLRIKNDAPAHFIVVGGAPFGEEIVMWWNFVARDKAEIEKARLDWERQEEYFGRVDDYAGPWLRAPSWRQRPMDKG